MNASFRNVKSFKELKKRITVTVLPLRFLRISEAVEDRLTPGKAKNDFSSDKVGMKFDC